MRVSSSPPPILSAAQADLRELIVRLRTDGVSPRDIRSAMELEIYGLFLEEAWNGEGETRR